MGSPKSGAGKGQKISAKSRPTSSKDDSPPSASTTGAAGAAPPPSADKPLPILLQPLFKSLTEACYNYMRCLHIWSIPVSDEGAVSLVSQRLIHTMSLHLTPLKCLSWLPQFALPPPFSTFPSHMGAIQKATTFSFLQGHLVPPHRGSG